MDHTTPVVVVVDLIITLIMDMLLLEVMVVAVIPEHTVPKVQDKLDQQILEVEVEALLLMLLVILQQLVEVADLVLLSFVINYHKSKEINSWHILLK
jgi:hypothetical protein